VVDDAKAAVWETGLFEDGADSPEAAGGELGTFKDAGIAGSKGVGYGSYAENVGRIPDIALDPDECAYLSGKADQAAIPKTTPYGSL